VGGLLDDPETFDYEIFGISRKEATLLDPQHRIFLEAAWHALEDAGYPGRSTARDCGVFASCGMNHWLREVLLPHGESMEGSAGFHLATANEKDFLAPQIAYRLNLTGPALTVQTACSSSLVAIATAVSALRAGDCEMALAGGVSVPMPQGRGYRYEPDMILSPDGHCRPFSQEASGTVPSSGVGVVLLKSLDKALADGDSIHAVIRGIGTSNDGSGKMAFSAPGVEGQAKAIRCALADARLCQEEIDYIEAHGTGTPLGDPVEVLALSRIFNGRTEPLLLGSVKSMIGHCDAAAGVAGLIKTALALQEEQIPASLHVDQLNSKINFASGPFEVVSRSRPWPNHDRPRRAGVSSFGIGGTNAHVILESVPEKAKGTETPSPHLPIVLTGQTEEAISRQLEDITTAIGSSSPSKWPSIASTLWARASRLPLRRAFVIDSPADRLVPVSESPRRVSTAPKLAFLMPGQGSQSPSMADSLCRHATEFQEHLDSFSRRLEPHLGRSINDMLYGADSLSAEDLNNTRVAQPLILAVSVASARLWQARGLTPDALLGHSIGEIAAAHLAGVMDQETVIRFITARANLMARQPRGAMLAIAMTEEACRRFVRDDLCLAAVNGPSQCVLSGPTEQIESLEHELAESTTICRRLRVSHAFHSSMMTEAAEQLVDVLRGASLSAPRIPIVSTITGEWLTDEQAVDPQFWAGQLTRTVRFSSALSTLQAKGISLGLDLGPGRVVGDMARTCGLESVSSMGLDCNATRACNVHLQVIANLWERGVPFDLPSSSGRSVARLPGYPFSRFRCAPDRLNTSAENAPELRYYAPILESLPEPESFISPRLTFLTSDGNEWVTKAADVLRNLGADLRIHHRSSDKVSGSDCLAQERSDWDRAFRQMPAAPNTLVFLAEAESSTVNDLRGAIAPTLRLMGLIQALQHHYPGQPCRVISLTLSHGPTSPGLAASLAAGQIARVEHPEIDIQLIDSDSSDHISRALRHGLAGSPHEGPILLRRNGAFRQALQSVQPSPATSWTGLTRGSLLVTGGFGHLGPVLAYSLAAFNDVTVVLLGRTVHPEVAETFHSRGIPLRCHALDLANTPAVRELVQDLAAEGKPVRGVIHAAGVADFGGIILRRT
jgi:acyl transferase domain-containing protein